jgi:hypothetical protein
MPKVYRIMKQAEDGKPVAGSGFGELGVRPRDVEANPPDEAHPGNGGMSVQPSLAIIALYYMHLVPRRLREANPMLFRGATAKMNGYIWATGSGPFADGPFAPNLILRCDEASAEKLITHGVVEPERKMSLSEFAEALAATRDEWNVEEK